MFLLPTFCFTLSSRLFLTFSGLATDSLGDWMGGDEYVGDSGFCAVGLFCSAGGGEASVVGRVTNSATLCIRASSSSLVRSMSVMRFPSAYSCASREKPLLVTRSHRVML